ncbi:uncharacterized protein PAC_11940 [Phialocephala subalpina]|uniref:Uncharacterized protein n=1 Tax=Phialocephala subalpina TaxID=576137 RepID=A0A1L7XAI4_9HELO|nr:uncharacterized protein PAC_11940 [Phialocephala subalpina]
MAATTIAPLSVEALSRLEASTFPSDIKESNAEVSIRVQEISNEIKKSFLTVSPYEELPHLLDLRTLDIPNQLLARALVGFKCLRDDYATANYVEIFNWPEVVENVKRMAAVSNHQWKKEKFYIVVFRSRIPPTTVYADLGVLDKAAHAEATKSGGFLKYWFGSPDSEGRNLATCVWRSPEDARIGSVGEAHRKAAGATRFLYTEWRIERLRLTIKDGATDWEITEWDQ